MHFIYSCIVFDQRKISTCNLLHSGSISIYSPGQAAEWFAFTIHAFEYVSDGVDADECGGEPGVCAGHRADGGGGNESNFHFPVHHSVSFRIGDLVRSGIGVVLLFQPGDIGNKANRLPMVDHYTKDRDHGDEEMVIEPVQVKHREIHCTGIGLQSSPCDLLFQKKERMDGLKNNPSAFVNHAA